MADFSSLLPRDILVKIFTHLGTSKDVILCSYLSHEIHQVTNEPELWHEIATIKYGMHVANASIHLYQGDYKSMLKDDNRRGACPTVDLLCKPCFSRLNDDSTFYCCIITAIQWDRVDETFKVYFDARGESDLGRASHSAIRVVRDDYLVGGTVHNVNLSIETNGHQKGYFVVSEEYVDRIRIFSFCYSDLTFSPFANYETITVCTGTLDSLPYEYYTIRGSSVFENDTEKSDVARWKKVLPGGFLEKRPDWWV